MEQTQKLQGASLELKSGKGAIECLQWAAEGSLVSTFVQMSALHAGRLTVAAKDIHVLPALQNVHAGEVQCQGLELCEVWMWNHGGRGVESLSTPEKPKNHCRRTFALASATPSPSTCTLNPTCHCYCLSWQYYTIYLCCISVVLSMYCCYCITPTPLHPQPSYTLKTYALNLKSGLCTCTQAEVSQNQMCC